ncbi:GGDEF domain-containing protein [Methylogaea oryzae]|nr:GGDEF domain-containing protein [Methylogaea oryzae]
MRDDLTGIPNRRHFNEIFEIEWRRAQRTGSWLAVALVDVDHFKQYNDHYGHGLGDQCLRQVSNALVSTLLRPGDFVARYGGEEFAAVLPGADLAGARDVAQRFRANVADLRIEHACSKAADVVTVSVGYAAVVACPEVARQSLVDMADRMLYRAKGGGRNRVCGPD